MRSLLISLLLIAPQGLSDLDKAHADLHAAKVSLLQTQEALAACQIKAQGQTLSEERTALEARFRAILKPAEGAVFNWMTLTFEEPK